jgi:hypothetical protein
MIPQHVRTIYEENKKMVWLIIFCLLCIFYVDIWNWNKITPLFFGLPYWVYYHFFLTVLSSLLFYVFIHQIWRDE